MATVTQDYVLKVTAQGLREVVGEIKALRGDLGKLSGVTTSTSEGFKKVSKSAGEYDRNQKGAAKATNNGTKAFSKMAQGMSGTLVPAYATVAANVFALTAAFGTLERAADFQILIDSADTLATQTGRSLVGLSKQMKDITGGAISMKDALTSASIAASAGFDNSTIEELTQVARNASVALGRDMTDSLNRVFKGAIKAEPELLDELGIILRLDPATREYAASIGKAVSELTTFEKQQAVVNAVIEEGQEKFGKLTEVETNPYTQLAAAFSDLSNNILSFISTPITGIIEFLTDNVLALGAAFIVFGSSITKAAIPAISRMLDNMQDVIIESNKLSVSNAIGAEALLEFSEAAGTTSERLKEVGEGNRAVVSGLIANDMKKLGGSYTSLANAITNTKSAQKALVTTVTVAEREIKKLTSGNKNLTKSQQIQLLALQDIRAAAKAEVAQFESLNKILDKLKSNNFLLKMQAQLAAVVARTTVLKNSLSQGFGVGLSQGFAAARESFKDFERSVLKAAGTTEIFGKVTKGLAKSIFLASGALGSFLRFIPIIGQLTFALTILGEGFNFLIGLFRDNDAIERFNDAIESSTEAIKTGKKAINEYNKVLVDLPDTIDNVTKKTELQRNVFVSLFDSLNAILTEAPDSFNIWDNFLDIFESGRLDNLKDQLQDQVDLLKEAGQADQVNSLLSEFGNIASLSGDEALIFARKLKELNKSLSETADKAFEANESFKSAFEDLGKVLDDELTSLPKLTSAFEQLVKLTTVLDIANIEGINERTISAFSTLGSKQVASLGISEEITALAKVSAELKSQNELLEKQKDIRKSSIDDIGLFNQSEQSIKIQQAQQSITITEENISKIKQQQVDITADIIKKSEEYLNILKTLKSAEENIQNIRSRSSFELGRPNITTLERLNILKDTADTEKVYYDTLRSVYNNRRQDYLRQQKELEKTVSSFIQLRDAVHQLDKPNILLNTTDPEYIRLQDNAIAASKKLSDVSRGLEVTEQILLDTRGKGAKEYINYLHSIEKEMFNNNLAVELGIKYADQYSNVLDTKFNTALENSYEALKLPNEELKQFKKRVTGLRDVRLDLDTADALSNFKGLQATVEEINKNRLDVENLGYQNELIKEYNGYLDERIDKQELLNIKELENTLSSLEAKEAIAAPGPELLYAMLQIAAVEDEIAQKRLLAAAKIKNYSENYIADLEKEITIKKIGASYGSNITKYEQQRLELEKERLKLSSKIDDEKEVDRLIDKFKELQKLEFKISFDFEIQDALAELSDLPLIFRELGQNIDNLEDPIDKVNAGFLAGIKISKDYGNESIEGLNSIGLVLTDFAKDVLNFSKGGFVDLQESSTKALIGLGSAIQKAAGDNAKAAKAGAIIEGVGAVIKAWNSAPFPYNIPAVATTVANVGALLSQINANANLGDTAGDAKAQSYVDSFGAQGVRGVDLQTNSLAESIDSLVDVNTNLFSAERGLQEALVDLSDTFQKVGAALFNVAGTFGSIDLLDIFGVSFGSTFDPGIFGDTTTTKELLASGIELGTTIEFLGDSIGASLDSVRLYLTQKKTEVDSGFFGIGGGTDVSIKTKYRDIPKEVEVELTDALDRTAEVITSLFSSLANTVDINLYNLFSAAEEIVISGIQLNLADKTAKEQSDTIAAFFSHLSNEVIEEILPGLVRFSRAGEELTDTLLRVTEQTIQLKNIFSTIDFDISKIIPENIFSITQSDLDAINVSISDSFDPVTRTITNSTIEGLRESIAKVELKLEKGGYIREGARFVNISSSLRKQLEDLNAQLDAAIEEGSQGIKTLDVVPYIEQLKAETFIQWQEALLANFKDIEELNTLFDKFSSTIFSETELAEIAIQNAENVISEGLSVLTSQLSSVGSEDLTAIIQEGISAETLRALYDAGLAADIFANKFDIATGEIDTSGADILATIIKLGAALDNLSTTLEDSTTRADEFNERLIRQIELFGLSGKELDLLQLEFDFQDSLKEAREVGGDIALVEEYYGLERINIIRRYNQEIIDILSETRDSISDSILDIRRELESWNEIDYQTNIISDLWDEFNSRAAEAKILAAESAEAYALAISTNLERETAKIDLELNVSTITDQLADITTDLENVISDQVAYNNLLDTVNAAIADMLATPSIIGGSILDSVLTVISNLLGLDEPIDISGFTGTLDSLYEDLQTAIQEKEYLLARLEQYGGIESSLTILKENIEDELKIASDALQEITDLGLVDIPELFSEKDLFSIEDQIDLINQLKDAILARYNAEKIEVENLNDLISDIGDYLDSLVLSDISPLTNQERLLEAQNQFTTTLANLNSEDAAIRQKAQEDLTDSADTYLQTASEFYGISKGFQDIFDSVTSTLKDVQFSLADETGLSADALALAALQQDTIAQLTVLDDILAELEMQNSTDYMLEVEAWATAIGNGSTLNDIVLKLESLEDAVWSSTLQNIPTFDTGTPEVEFDQIAKIHKGEMILTPKTSEEVRSGESIITNTNNTIEQIQPSGSNEDVVAAINLLIQVLADSQEDILEQGERLLIKVSEETTLTPSAKLTSIL